MISIDEKKYIDGRFREFEKRQKIIDAKNHEAMVEAKKEMDRRLEGMNEFRAQLTEQTRTFIRRDEYQLSEKLINQKYDTLSKIVYIGVGMLIILEVILNIIIK